MYDYRSLAVLDAVISEGGFERGAQVLHMTQSAVSQRLKSLEENVGQTLLVRSNPPQPTEAGQRFIKHYRMVRLLERDLGEAVTREGEHGWTTLPVGVNEDSLITWFPFAVEGLMHDEQILLDVRVDDQEVTHTLLRDGEVMGCVSTREKPLQGCRSMYLGSMRYRCMASRQYADRYFSGGFTLEAAKSAPVVIFNRKDNLQRDFFRLALGEEYPQLPAHYVPDSEAFLTMIAHGAGWGMAPDMQWELRDDDRLVDLAPGLWLDVPLYWQCWNIKSELLGKLTQAVRNGSKGLQ